MDKMRNILTGSASSALAALLMVGAIAFGSTVIRPMSFNHEPEATAAQADDGSAAGTDGGATEPTDGDKPDGGSEATGDSTADSPDHFPDWQPAGEPTAPPAEEPKDEPAATPAPEPKDEPAPAPSTSLSLEAVFNADLGKIVVEWSAYTGSFEKYKLVRSSDSAATWPLGDGDQLVDVVGPDGQRRFVDGEAPCGTELHYRAFAVRSSGESYVVVASSNVDGATRACDQPTEPPAEPVAMAFEVGQTADGVQLGWGQCISESFAVYKIVRSATNENPTFPLNDGTELIGVFENAEVTGFTDSNVEPGQTWTYRVLCMGQNADGYFVIGLTAAMTVTVE